MVLRGVFVFVVIIYAIVSAEFLSSDWIQDAAQGDKLPTLNILFSERTESRLQCSMMAGVQGARSFTFSPGNADCVAMATKDELLPNESTTHTGAKYYYKFGQLIDESCSGDFECISPNNQCRGGACTCMQGYPMSEQNKTCSVDCNVYGSTFTPEPVAGWIDSPVWNEYLNITADACRSLCLGPDSHSCFSYDFFDYGGGETYCYTNNVTLANYPFYLDSDSIHYTRNCV